jgi:hypothetical protein
MQSTTFVTPKVKLVRGSFISAVALSLGSSIGLAFSDANWTVLGSGMNDRVYALAVSGTNVYAGGRFTMAGGKPVGYIAKWDGNSWTGLGSGLNSWVRALAVSGTNLYAGGDFTTAGGITANRIAKWDGSNWSALRSGVGNYNVSVLAVSGSNVYVGGSFSVVDGLTSAHNIAKWNGSSWSALGSGTGGTDPSPEVLSLAVSGSDLYVGGDFTTAGGNPANHIAKWNGTSWSALGAGMGSGNAISVYAIVVSGTNLFAGGIFTTAGATNGAADVARWNGSSWSSLGVGMSVSTNYYPSVYALATHGNDLYAGGDFTKAGGVVTNRNLANRIAKWDGTNWAALGSGMNTNVFTLAVSGDDLYAAGEFTTAGGKAAACVARAYLPELPLLSMLPSGADVTVFWPSTNTEGFALEQSDGSIAPLSWAPVAAIAENDGTNKSVTMPAIAGPRYFRLRKQ